MRTRMHRYALLGAAGSIVLALSGSFLPRATQASGAHAAAPIAHVRYIQHGLTVQPPRSRPGKGKVKQSLFNRYALQTRRREKASINFRDGTLLHMNQLTAAVLQTAAVTQVRSGEVEEQVVPGTSHRVQTAAAVASAVGTIFDVVVRGKVTIITVVEGAVLVQTAHGSVLVKSGQQVRITKGKAPPQPQPVDAGSATSWTSSIPPPSAPLGTNIALDANGGAIYHWTSQRDDPNHAFDAGNANDGSTDRGWQSAPGQVTDQSLWVHFQGLKSYTITGIILDCAATGSQDPADAAQDFEVLASSDPSGTDAGFTAVYRGTCAQDNRLQVFSLATQMAGADANAAASASVQAAALQFHFKNNHGGKDGVAVAEVGVIGEEEPAVLGTPTPEPTDIPTPTDTPTPTPTAIATATATATPTSVPHFRFTFPALHASWQFPANNGPLADSVSIAGSACGSDPATVTWSAPFVVSGQTITRQFNFASGNPVQFYTDQYINQGTLVGRVTVSLQLLTTGGSPQMQLQAQTTGTVQNLMVDGPAAVAVQQVSSC